MSIHGEAMQMGMWKEFIEKRIKDLDNEIEKMSQQGESTKELELKKKALIRRHRKDLDDRLITL
jgi:hypothetical protein